MRVAARLASPLLRWGHDRVVEVTVVGFRRNLNRGAVPPGRYGVGHGRPAD